MLGMGIVEMAKKQSGDAPKGRPKSEAGPTKQILTLRGRDDYKEWLTRYAKFRRSQFAELVADALELMAKGDKFEAPPQRR